MSVIRPVTRSILSSVISSVIKGPVTRYFTQLESAASKHYTIPTVTLTGDFVAKAKFSSTATSGLHMIIGLSTGSDSFITLNAANGVINARLPSSIGITGTITVNDGKLHEVSIVKTGTSYEMFIDDVSDGTAAGLSGNVVFDQIGRNSFGNFFDGIVSDISFIDAGTPVRFYPINENLALGSTIIDTISGQNGTAVNIATSDFYTLNAAGTIWTSPTAPDLEIA